MNNSIETVIEIISRELDVEKEQVKMNASFVDDLGANSLDNVQLIMAIEEEFDIAIDDEDAKKLNTVESLIDFVSKNT
jgi:acyl carrier protein